MEEKYNLADFLDDLTGAFNPMRHVDDDAEYRWNQLVKRKLSNFSGAVLKRAFDDLVSTRKSRSHPAVADLIYTCQKAERIIEASKPRELPVSKAIPTDACEAYIVGERLWNDLVMHSSRYPAIAIQAAKEDCMGALRAFVIRQHRLPKSLDEKIKWFRSEAPHSVREEKRRADKAYEFVVRGEYVKPDQAGTMKSLDMAPVFGALRRLGDQMMTDHPEKSRRAMREKILGAKA